MTAAVCLGFDASFMRFYYVQGTTTWKFIWQCMKFPLLSVLLLAPILLEPSHFVAKFLLKEETGVVFLLLVVLYLFVSVIRRFSLLNSRMAERAWNYVAAVVLEKVSFIAAILLAFFVLRGFVTLNAIVLAFLASILCVILINLPVLAQTRTRRNSDPAPVTTGEMFHYGYPFILNNAIILLVPMIEKLIVRDLAGWRVLGVYTAATAFATAMSLLAVSIDNVWQPYVFQNFQNEARFKRYFYKIGMAITYLVTILLAVCVLLRRWLVLLLGPHYNDVMIIAPVVLFGSGYNIITNIYSIGIDISRKTHHLIISPVIQCLSSVALCFLLIPRFNLIGVGIASLCSVLGSRTYKIYFGIHEYGTGRSSGKAAVMIGGCIAVAVSALFITSFPFDFLAAAFLALGATVLIHDEMKSYYAAVRSWILPYLQKYRKHS